MAVYRQDDKHRIRQSNKKASTAISLATFLTIGTDGLLAPAVAASTNIAGVAMQAVFSDQTDYASTTPLVFDEPRAGDQFIVDTTGGTPAQTNVGEFFDLSDAGTVNLAAAGTVKHVKCVALAGGTRIVVEVNPAVLFSA